MSKRRTIYCCLALMDGLNQRAIADARAMLRMLYFVAAGLLVAIFPLIHILRAMVH